MKADVFLSRLTKVRQTGPENWVACCPAHDDKNPSMTIREKDDGRVLVHCFAGCEVEEILSAVGLTFDALFPEQPIFHRGKPIRRPFPASDVLECLANEATIAAIASARISRGEDMSEGERTRLRLANQRIQAAVEVVNG